VYDVPFSESELDELRSLATDLNAEEEHKTQESLMHFSDSVAEFESSDSGHKLLPIAVLSRDYWPGIDQLNVLIQSLFRKGWKQASDLVIIASFAGQAHDALIENGYARALIRNKGGNHFDVLSCVRPGPKTEIEKQFEDKLKPIAHAGKGLKRPVSPGETKAGVDPKPSRALSTIGSLLSRGRAAVVEAKIAQKPPKCK